MCQIPKKNRPTVLRRPVRKCDAPCGASKANYATIRFVVRRVVALRAGLRVVLAFFFAGFFAAFFFAGFLVAFFFTGILFHLLLAAVEGHW